MKISPAFDPSARTPASRLTKLIRSDAMKVVVVDILLDS